MCAYEQRLQQIGVLGKQVHTPMFQRMCVSVYMGVACQQVHQVRSFSFVCLGSC